MNRALRLPKLTCPAASRAYPRARLFSRLDAALEGRVIWISAPAGAGKTTLVASHVATRGHVPLWYHLDRGDADPAAFFAQLSEGIGSGAALPAFTAEYFGGLEAFARRFFRKLYAVLPPRRVLVFDDYHEVESDSPFHEVMRQALAEVPEGLSVIVVSRNDPPPPLARLRMREDFTLIGRDELVLTPEESEGVCRIRWDGQPLGAAALTSLYERTQGWMAGLVLLLEQSRGYGTSEDDAPLVFDYLAGEVFARMSGDEQSLLLKTALLPSFSADTAATIAALPNARELLEALHRRNYFTVRHQQEERPPSYEYHPLFRQFLLGVGRQRIPHAELNALKRRAAGLLASSGELEACVALLTDIGDWTLLVQLTLEHAPRLLTEGRHRTLQAWLSGLPSAVQEREPWLNHFHGLAVMPFDLGRARTWFERAYDGFKRENLADGMYLAWAGAVDTYLYAWGSFGPADRWIAELETLRAQHPQWPSLEIELRVTAGMFALLMYRRPDHPELPAWTDHLEALLFREVDPVLRMTAAAHLVLYLSWWRGDLKRAGALLERLRAHRATEMSAPLAQVTWASAQAIYDWVTGDTAACTRAAEEGLRVSEETGVRVWDAMLLAQRIWTEITCGHLEEADALLERARALLDPSQALHACQYHFQRLCHAAYLDDHDTTLSHAEQALAKAKEAGVIWAEGVVRYGKALAHHLRGESALRDEELAVTERIWRRIDSDIVGQGALLVRAFAAADSGEEPALRRHLGDAFGLMRRTGLNNSSIFQPARLSRLCALALHHGIDPDYARALIRVRRLEPDPLDACAPAWPWPVRIHTLGRFEVMIRGAPLVFQGKSQRRPLELLMMLLAHGGRQVPEARLVEELWPDAEGDAGHNAFVTTLQRLRKLLGGTELLQYRDGTVTLDPLRCWVDLWALEERNEVDVERWLSLYRGPFLRQMPDAAWAFSTRERLRRAFVRAVLRQGEALSAGGDWSAAEALYERALVAEENVEELQRRLSTCRSRPVIETGSKTAQLLWGC